jgi:hypothetical protein
LTRDRTDAYRFEVSSESLGTGTRPLVTGMIEPVLENDVEHLLSKSAGDWLCAWCLNPVAKESDRFQYEGKDRFTFCNPSGVRFEIITFSQADGCRVDGRATLEHTWFAGHAWSFCHCARCRQHLGWHYVGPHRFFGLITESIIRACIRN